jgi:hypothetical protein
MAVRVLMTSGPMLMLALLFLPWYDRAYVIGYNVTRTALEPPHGWLAVLAWLTTGAVLAEVVLVRMRPEGLPRLVVPWAQVQTAQGAAVFILVLLKFIVTGHYAWGSWLGLLLAAAFASAAWAANHQPAPERNAP